MNLVQRCTYRKFIPKTLANTTFHIKCKYTLTLEGQFDPKWVDAISLFYVDKISLFTMKHFMEVDNEVIQRLDLVPVEPILH
jgi:hypothetical protein